MDCIFSCWTQDTPPPPLFGNTLLTDPLVLANEHKWNALTYEFIHLIAIAAFVALSIGVLTWAIFFAAEYQATTLLASTFLFSVTYPICFHPYRIEAQIYWHKEAFENQVSEKIQTIKTEYNRRKTQEPQYLMNLHHKIGAGRLPQEIAQRIKTTTQKVSAYESLIPLYARAIAYNEEAEKTLDRLTILILNPQSQLNQQNIAEWRKLEENYLALRMRAIQVATIASNPIQGGDAIGTITSIDPATEALWLEYAPELPPPCLFIFKNGSHGMTRTHLMKIHTDALRDLITKALDTTSTTQNGRDAESALSQDEWRSISESILELVRKRIKEPTREKVFQALESPIFSRELLFITAIRDAVQTKASHTIRQILEEHSTQPT